MRHQHPDSRARISVVFTLTQLQRRQTWPQPVDLREKLWHQAEFLRQTADFAMVVNLTI